MVSAMSNNQTNTSQPPEQRYSQQLEQLAAMGFLNREANLQGESISRQPNFDHILQCVGCCEPLASRQLNRYIKVQDSHQRTYLVFSADRDVRRRECGRGEATGPRAAVHELTLARPVTHLLLWLLLATTPPVPTANSHGPQLSNRLYFLDLKLVLE